MWCAALVAVALQSCGGTLRPPKRTYLSTRDIVDRSKPAIVRIDVVRRDGVRGMGTGFVVSPDGRIVTNLHVIEGTSEAIVTLLDGSEHPVVRVVGADPQRDLAVVEIAPARRLPVLELGDSDEVAAGDIVIAIGNPQGLDYSVSDGLISSIREFVKGELKMIQISAPISLGSSGGPLFNRFGEVIGVAVAVSAEGQNLNFGIPSNYLRPLITAQGMGSSLERFGAHVRDTPWGSPEESESGSCSYPPVSRKIPALDISALDTCSRDELATVFSEIRDAIEVGAPLYNPPICNAEACYRVYEGVVLRLLRSGSCAGISETLTQGLTRAERLPSYHAKAWAMRDTFDGIMESLLRWARTR